MENVGSKIAFWPYQKFQQQLQQCFAALESTFEQDEMNHLLILVTCHGRRQVIELNKAGDTASSSDQLQLSESSQGAEQLSQLCFANSVTKVANKQGIAGWVILGVAHCREDRRMLCHGQML